MSTPTIRLATSADAQAILDIYSPYVPTAVTFEETIPTPEAFQARVDDVLETYPYLAAEMDGKVVGYAYAHKLREREGYRWNAELSVYLWPDVRGHGLGNALYSTLIELCAACGYKAVYGITVSPNKASRHLHVSLGFEAMMTWHNAGYTCGEWRNITWYVKFLSDTFEDNPASPTLFPVFCEQSPERVSEILAKGNGLVKTPRSK